MAFVLVNSIDPAERPHYVAAHLGLYYLPKSLVYKGLNAKSLKVNTILNQSKIISSYPFAEVYAYW